MEFNVARTTPFFDEFDVFRIYPQRVDEEVECLFSDTHSIVLTLSRLDFECRARTGLLDNISQDSSKSLPQRSAGACAPAFHEHFMFRLWLHFVFVYRNYSVSTASTAGGHLFEIPMSSYLSLLIVDVGLVR